MPIERVNVRSRQRRGIPRYIQYFRQEQTFVVRVFTQFVSFTIYLQTIEKMASPTYTTVTCHQVHKSSNTPSYACTCPIILRHLSSNISIAGRAIIDDQSDGTYVDLSVSDRQSGHRQRPSTPIETDNHYSRTLKGMTVSPLDQFLFPRLWYSTAYHP